MWLSCCRSRRMTSISCESPVRRFTTKQIKNKENSPVELNRLKNLLKIKTEDDSSVSSYLSSSKTAGTPRTEIKVKSGATVKLCSSCAIYNKNVSVIPASNTAEQKTSTRKPREIKKKAITREKMLDMPSTSGTASRENNGTMSTDSGNHAEVLRNLKEKRRCKKVGNSVHQNKSDALVGKETISTRKAKNKNIIKVKVPLSKKTTKTLAAVSKKSPFESMNITELINSKCDEEIQNDDTDINYMCWKYQMEKNHFVDSSSIESSPSYEGPNAESSSPNSSSDGTTSFSSANKEKKKVKPTYKEKLNKFYSSYDSRCITCTYDLRSKDRKA